jgi:O-antigen ligase
VDEVISLNEAPPGQGLMSWLKHCIQDPKLYYTFALFAGEAGPSFFRVGSGWMFLLALIGTLFLFIKRRFAVRRTFSIVLLIYAIVLIRNITLNPAVALYYEIPNLGTALILLLMHGIFYKNEDIEQIESYLFFYSAILVALGVFKFIQHPSQRLAVFGGPNGYYKIALLFEVLCYSRFLRMRKKRYVVLSLIGLILCAATGSKGGIAAMIVILVLELFFFVYHSGKKRKTIVNRILQVCVIILLSLVALTLLLKRSPALAVLFQRATSFLMSRDIVNSTSVRARTELIRLGMRFFAESPIIGKGAWYTFFFTNGAQPYPHNIFVEFLSEQGLVGTIPFVLFLLGLFHQWVRYGRHDVSLFCLFLCFVVYFIGSLFSGNILDAKPIFVFGILINNSVLNHRKQRFALDGRE